MLDLLKEGNWTKNIVIDLKRKDLSYCDRFPDTSDGRFLGNG
jgi:hypothetical protein